MSEEGSDDWKQLSTVSPSLDPDSNDTQISQMTASSLPQSDSDAKWICETCTYENFPLSRKCTMCRNSKPLLGEDIYRLQDGASSHSTETNAIGAEAVTDRLKPLRISSPLAQPGASAATKWTCSSCTYENWPKSQKCAMCGTMAPPCAAMAVATCNEKQSKHSIGINDLASIHDIHNEMDTTRRSKRRNIDWMWLQACLGVVEGNASLVTAYLSHGGDPARSLAPHEVAVLDRSSAFDTGHTLVHLAIRFKREEILTMLLSRISGGGSGVKRVPAYIAPDLANAIRRHIASCIRTKKGSFNCKYITEFCTFSLPSEIEELPAVIQEQLFSELLDREAQRTLEAEPALINWSLELTMRLGSRLFALWNGAAGECLLDAVSQAAYGVPDCGRALRGALGHSLTHHAFYERWRCAERLSSECGAVQYVQSDRQLAAEWSRLQTAANTPGAALTQLHVFALAHIMRRPIIVYGVNIVNSFRGEALGYANFQGVYLPLLWEPEFCSKSPLCVGYTRGHFSALVPCAPCSRPAPAYICREQQEEKDETTFLPLTDSEGKLLPVHFLTQDEMADEEGLLRRWVSSCVTSGGLLAARQRLHPKPLLVAQMMEEWLNHYRRLAQQTRGPFPPRLRPREYSPETDDE